MSNLVDKWTNEFAKRWEKGRNAGTASSGGTSPRAEPEAQPSRMVEEAAPVAYPGLSQALRIKPRPPTTLFSDTALAMMVDCFSP